MQLAEFSRGISTFGAIFIIVTCPFSYQAGDVLMVMPQNSCTAVEHFVSVMGYSPHQLVTIEQNDPGRGQSDSHEHTIPGFFDPFLYLSQTYFSLFLC